MERNVLVVDAAFVAVCGTLGLAARSWIAERIALGRGVVAALAVGLLLYAAYLAASVARRRAPLRVLWIAIVADIVWLLGSVGLFAARGGAMTGSGVGIVLVLDAIVAAIAVAEWRATRSRAHALDV